MRRKARFAAAAGLAVVVPLGSSWLLPRIHGADPGERDRGARRLITGSKRALYYTADHYAGFVVVDAAATG